MIQKPPKYILINLLSVFFFFVIFCFIPVYANSLNVTLVGPNNNEIFNTTNNVTFTCNVTSSQYMKSISLYHDLNGSFVLNQTNYFGELEPDSSTVLLMYFIIPNQRWVLNQLLKNYRRQSQERLAKAIIL